MQLAGVAGYRLALAVDGDELVLALKTDLQVPREVLVLSYLAANVSSGCAKLDSFLESRSTERFGVRENIYRFEPVSFSLSVVTIKNIQAFSPKILPGQIAKIFCLNGPEDHVTNLNISRLFPPLNAHNKEEPKSLALHPVSGMVPGKS
jgi:hypothetical protein